MEMTGQQHIPATKQKVWDALNDADILRVCIPGCQELIKSSDTEMSAVAVIKVGPVKARFQGAVTLSDLDPPNGCKIMGEGQGGVAGFAKGGAVVRLEEIKDGTILHYTVEAQIGGKLSQLGGRLIDVTAKQLSGQFFKKFAEEILARGASQAATGSVDQGTAGAATEVAAAGERSQADARTFQGAPTPYRPAQQASSAVSLAVLAITVFVAVLIAMWAIYGGLLPSLMPAGGDVAADGRAHVSPDAAGAAQLIMAAAIGYLFGARSARRD